MLDDCKGEKFEEVLLHFSTAVLQKVIRRYNGDVHFGGISEQLGLSLKGAQSDHTHQLQPLMYAHEASLRRSLDERELRKQRLRALTKTLQDKADSVQSEEGAVSGISDERGDRLKTSGIDATAMKKQIRNSCVENTDWLSIALNGDPLHDRDEMVEDTFDKLWHNGMSPEKLPVPYDSIQPGLLTNLEQRVKQQQERLSRWRSFQAELSRRNQDFIVSHSPAKTPYRSPQKSRFGSNQKSPSRTGSTRRPQRNTQAQVRSTRLQDLQSSPTKPVPTPKDDRAVEARNEAPRSLESPPDIFKRPKVPDCAAAHVDHSQVRKDEMLCEGMTDLKIAPSSPTPTSPYRNATTPRRTRLPSPTKHPMRRAQPPDPNTSSIDPIAARKNRHDPHPMSSATQTAGQHLGPCSPSQGSANPEQPQQPQPPPHDKQEPSKQEPASPAYESLTERTARTMSAWQQKQSAAPRSKPSQGSKTHRHTQSVPQHTSKPSSSVSSPERAAVLSHAKAPIQDTQIHVNGDTPRVTVSGQQESSSSPRPEQQASSGYTSPEPDTGWFGSPLNSPPPAQALLTETPAADTSAVPTKASTFYKPASPPQAPSTHSHPPETAATDTPAAAPHEETPPEAVTPLKAATPPQAPPLTEDEEMMSIFKPRNRLKRTPPGSPSPWG